MRIIKFNLRFVAFPATEYDEVPSGYQPGQRVERWKIQRFEDHLCPRPQYPEYPEDEDTDGLPNVGFFTAQPFDPADSPRELHQNFISLEPRLIFVYM
jgi:hypothetical protein